MRSSKGFQVSDLQVARITLAKSSCQMREGAMTNHTGQEFLQMREGVMTNHTGQEFLQMREGVMQTSTVHHPHEPQLEPSISVLKGCC